MGWVKDALKELELYGSCKVRPHGGSMRGRIESGQLVSMVANKTTKLQIEDAVLVRWKGNYLLHLIKEISSDEVLIGNNIGKLNGWIPKQDVIAIVTAVED